KAQKQWDTKTTDFHGSSQESMGGNPDNPTHPRFTKIWPKTKMSQVSSTEDKSRSPYPLSSSCRYLQHDFFSSFFSEQQGSFSSFFTAFSSGQQGSFLGLQQAI
ncbi:MAG: hypothetical protein KAI38_09305, partial [Candidatus Latescibacteria bacterium]|nr:hypothetical protein [Candidatus Latescibacterota bacterium]